MTANVAMIEAGMATAAMSVERHERMKSSTMTLARMLPATRCPWISCRAARMYRDWSWMTSTVDVRRAAARGARQAALDGLDHLDGVRARLPLHLQHDGRLAVEPGQRADFLAASTTSPRSRSRTAVPPTVATTRSGKSRGVGDAAQRAQAQLAEAGVDAAAGHLGVLPRQAPRAPA